MGDVVVVNEVHRVGYSCRERGDLPERLLGAKL